MTKLTYIFIANIFFALSTFAGYEIEIQEKDVTIKKDNIVIKTVLKDKKNKKHIKQIKLYINQIEEIKTKISTTCDALPALGLEHLLKEASAKDEQEIKTVEGAIEAVIKLI